MSKDPTEILQQRNAEVAKIRGFVDLTEEAKQRRIEEVSEKARAEYAEATEAAEREIAGRLEKTERAVFRVPVSPHATDAEEAHIHAAFRSAYNEVHSATRSPESPQDAQEELERILQLAERTGDKLLARASYHRAIDLGAQGVVDSYLSSRPSEERAWASYTEAYRDAQQSRSYESMLARGLAERAFSSEAG